MTREVEGTTVIASTLVGKMHGAGGGNSGCQLRVSTVHCIEVIL